MANGDSTLCRLLHELLLPNLAPRGGKCVTTAGSRYGTFEPDTHQQQATTLHSVCKCINALTAPVLVAYGKARKRRQRIARRRRWRVATPEQVVPA